MSSSEISLFQKIWFDHHRVEQNYSLPRTEKKTKNKKTSVRVAVTVLTVIYHCLTQNLYPQNLPERALVSIIAKNLLGFGSHPSLLEFLCSLIFTIFWTFTPLIVCIICILVSMLPRCLSKLLTTRLNVSEPESKHFDFVLESLFQVFMAGNPLSSEELHPSVQQLHIPANIKPIYPQYVKKCLILLEL